MDYSQATKGQKKKKQIKEEDKQMTQAIKNSVKDEYNRQMEEHWEEERQVEQAKRNSTDDLVCQTFLHPNLRTKEEKDLADHLVFNQTTRKTLDGKQAKLSPTQLSSTEENPGQNSTRPVHINLPTEIMLQNKSSPCHPPFARNPDD
jgi:hypothetical protein